MGNEWLLVNEKVRELLLGFNRISVRVVDDDVSNQS